MDADADIERPDAGEALRKIARGMSDPSGIHDPRLHIERIRLNPYRSDPAERTEAMVWKLLERFPDSTLSHDYALWYFLSSGSYDTAFSLNANHPEGPRPLYSALESALLGNAGQSIDYFMELANDDNLAWLGLADAALVHYRLGNKETALEDLILAASMAPNRIQESRIQYHIAVLLESMRLMDRAESVLGYALELNPENHLARAMLGKIRAGK
jgi:tetratricopeptide (TPR) repeat protein